MKIDSLKTLHPAWSDVKELDQLIDHLSGLPETPPVGSIPLPDAKFPPALAAAIEVPTSSPPPPAGSQRAASERVARLQTSLNDHSARVLDRERAAMEKRLEAESAVERSRIKDQAPPQLFARNPQDEKELRKLEFELIALESQVRVFFEPALSEAQQKLNKVAARIKELRAPPAVQEEVQEAAIEKQVEAFRARRRADYQKELGQRTAQLNHTAASAVASYEAGLKEKLAAADPPPPIKAPDATRVPDMRLSSPQEVAGEALRSTPQGAASPVAKRLAGLRAQRDRLASIITDDIRRRIGGLATIYHWTLVGEGAGAADLTPQAADLLRQQFAPVK